MSIRLNALDMAFLGLETQRTPVNVAALQIFETPAGYKGNFVRDLLGQLADAKPGPPFNLKLGTLGPTPILQWVTDDHFDLDYHVRHSALPKPGDMSDLLALVSRLHSRVMDRERPLWEFHVIEGLRKRRFAIYMKMHHAAIDGMGGIALMEACLSQTPGEPVCAPWVGFPQKTRDDSEQESTPRPNAMLHGAGGMLRQLGELPDVGKLFASHGLKALGLKPADSPVLFGAPRSMFNGHISGARRFVINSIPLSAMKDLAKRTQATVNDIILTVCSGALRRYLSERGELPEKSLVASIPVSIRQINRSGNQITYVIADLATAEPDPLARLQAVHESTKAAKHEVSEVSASAATTFAVLAQGAVAVLNRFRLAGLLPPPANVVISNVPGPREPLYLGTARMLASYPLSVLVDGQALNITVVSYCDAVDFGIMACRDTVPEAERIGEYLDESFAELGKAVEQGQRPKRPARPARPTAVKPARKRATSKDVPSIDPAAL